VQSIEWTHVIITIITGCKGSLAPFFLGLTRSPPLSAHQVLGDGVASLFIDSGKALITKENLEGRGH
jgi:hypothetical protein